MDGNTDTTSDDQTARIARVATLIASLILAALLFGAREAQASSPLPALTPLAFEEEFEEADEAEFAEEECETAEEEVEEGELSKAEGEEICREARETAKEAAAGSSGAGECPIHSAIAHSSIHNDRLKLTIGYTTNTPVTATIQLSGPVKASFKRRLGRSGVLHFTEQLANEHGRLAVHIELPASERAECPSRRLVLFPR